ncbi:MAG: cytochrome P450 [Candidatus Eremiobacteraeota bacterium]|nr:cytochrome P450 [Candidatus Eremiobacteraeota bacterium]MCW5869890.1 cytochrome P450 [Candidatus Eremiobacteraeota bacterium]
MRGHCPVAYSPYLGWSLFRHQDIQRVLHDHETFSNVVSTHPAVPNGMDPPLHTHYRRLLDPYFSATEMERFEPVCREIAATCLRSLPGQGEVDFCESFAEPFALSVQCAFTGWPGEVKERLRQWLKNQQKATLAGDREATARLAGEFEDCVRGILAARRLQPQADLTTRLLQETLSETEIISILRNWTVGELGTIAAAVGILVHYLCVHREVQSRLRRQPAELAPAIEEILRLEAPLLSNRRLVKQATQIGQHRLEAGDRVTLMWASGNRDETVFPDSASFRPERDQEQNLLYGSGIHACPGAPLARLELRVALQCLLEGTRELELSQQREPVRATYPAAGFASLPIVVKA